jgi:hypothetical protein
VPEWRIFPQDVVYRPQFEGCRLANGGYNSAVGIASKQSEAAPLEAVFAPQFWEEYAILGRAADFFAVETAPSANSSVKCYILQCTFCDLARSHWAFGPVSELSIGR